MWITPKTDWLPTDYFNLADYNRIKGNIEHVIDYAKQMYIMSDAAVMADEAVGYVVRPDFQNGVEHNVQLLADETYKLPEFKDGRIVAPKDLAWDYKDLNRLEANTLLVKKMLDSQLAGLKRLAFELGGVQFG